MAVILDISATVPEATIRDFTRACDRYRDELGNSQAVAIRRGTIALIKSLRTRTPKAKKQTPSRNIRRVRPDESYPYVTPKGRKRPHPRWVVIRRGGADKTVYYKPTNPSESDAPVKTKSEAVRRWGQHTRWGLARKSWGWFMHALFNRANPESANPKAKIDSRMVDGHPLREVVTGPNRRVEVLIVNKLGYMRDILPNGALEEAMRAATRSINTQIDEGHAKARKEMT